MTWSNKHTKYIDYSICIPVYNSAKVLPELLQRIQYVFTNLDKHYEIILVNDGSNDNSWEVLKHMHTKYTGLIAINLTKNYGQPNALLCAFKHVKGRYIITIDDDLQHPPEEIPKLIQAMENMPNVDGIIGVPLAKKHNFVRNLCTEAMNQLNSYIFKKPKDLRMASFRILKRWVVDNMVQCKSHNLTIAPLLLSITVNLRNVPVEHLLRQENVSGYTLFKLVIFSLDNILNYTTAPLKFISVIGLSSSLSGFVLALYFVLRQLFVGQALVGWTILIIMNLFFFGLLILSTGILGEYLIRILRQVNLQEQYNIKEKLANR